MDRENDDGDTENDDGGRGEPTLQSADIQQMEPIDALVLDNADNDGLKRERELSPLLIFDTRPGSSLRIFDSDEAPTKLGRVGGDFSLHSGEEEDAGPAEQVLLKRRALTGQDIGQRVPDRGRLRIHNVGGSLTVLLQIALLAWGVRQLRSVLAKRRHKQTPRINTIPFRLCDPPLTCTVTPVALKKLLESNCIPHLLVDVRFPEAFQSNKLPPIKNSTNTPEAEIKTLFQLPEAELASHFPSMRSLDRNTLIVFLSTKGRRAQRAALSAAELGYNGCCVLSGGISEFYVARGDEEHSLPSFLSRDAVAVLLQNKKGTLSGTTRLPNPYLVDVRRYDERALYGHIHSSVHVPANEWPKALAMEPLDWQKSYGNPKFDKEDVLILYCRTNNRSAWAAQVACDAGVKRCFVLQGGAVGWHLDPSVQPYDGYGLGQAPPEPHRFELEAVNYTAAEQELHQFGLS